MPRRAMTQARKSTNFLSMGIIFGVLAVFFALMNYFHVIKNMDEFLAATYIVYFVGLALLYNSAYCKMKGYQISRTISMIVGIICVLASIAMLIYGFASGTVTLFN